MGGECLYSSVQRFILAFHIQFLGCPSQPMTREGDCIVAGMMTDGWVLLPHPYREDHSYSVDLFSFPEQILKKEEAIPWPGTLAIVHSYIAYKEGRLYVSVYV